MNESQFSGKNEATHSADTSRTVSDTPESSSALLKEKLAKTRADWLKARSEIANHKDEIEELKRKVAISEQEKKYMEKELTENKHRQAQIGEMMEKTKKEASEATLSKVQIASERDDLEEKVNEAWSRVATLLDENEKRERERKALQEALEKEAKEKAALQQQQEHLQTQLEAAKQEAKVLSHASSMQDRSGAQLVHQLGAGIRVITKALDEVSSVCLTPKKEDSDSEKQEKIEELCQLENTLETGVEDGSGSEEEQDRRLHSVCHMLLHSLARSIQPLGTVLHRAHQDLQEANTSLETIKEELAEVNTDKNRLEDEMKFLKEKIETFEKLEDVFDEVMSEKCSLERELADLQKQLLERDTPPPSAAEGSVHSEQENSELSNLYHSLQFQYKEALKYIEEELEPLTENQAMELAQARARLAAVDHEREELYKQKQGWENQEQYSNLLETVLVLARAYTGLGKDFGEVIHQRKAITRYVRGYESKYGTLQMSGTSSHRRSAIRRFRVAVVTVLASLRLIKLANAPELREAVWAQRLSVVGCPRVRHRLRLPVETRTYLTEGKLVPSDEVVESQCVIRHLTTESLSLPVLFVDKDRRERHVEALPTYIGMLEDVVTVNNEMAGPSPPPPLSELLQSRLKSLLYERTGSSSRSRSRTPQDQHPAAPTASTNLRHVPTGGRSPQPYFPPPSSVSSVSGRGSTPRGQVPYPSAIYTAADPSALNSSSIAPHSPDTSVEPSAFSTEDYLLQSIAQDERDRSKGTDTSMNLFTSEVLGAIEALDRRVTGALQRRR